LESNKKHVPVPVIVIYSLVFYAVWAVFTLLIEPLLGDSIKNEILLRIVKEGIIKNLVWTVPAMLLVYHFRDCVFIGLREMFTTKVKWLRYLPVFIFFTLWIAGGSFMRRKELSINEGFGIPDMIIVLFVGITEEMVFRGWLLNATVREDNKWPYILLNALMFMAIHFPIWISTGIFVSCFTSLCFVSIIILSFIFSLTFLKSRNILVPVALHMYWDLLMFMYN